MEITFAEGEEGGRYVVTQQSDLLVQFIQDIAYYFICIFNVKYDVQFINERGLLGTCFNQKLQATLGSIWDYRNRYH